jgi:dGTPase
VIDMADTTNVIKTLADYAVHESLYGRTYKEEPPKYRNDFQRDRDRIIHSSAFRRLEYKTQVFINHEGDLFRTRLTHSLEVAQIGRSVAGALGLNVDLVEAICLAHDLGHTPFGHAGQDVLNSCLIDAGYEGFEHNLQSLRIVDVVEERYAEFDGLNLTFETKEGILKHCSLKKAQELGQLGARFLTHKQPSLEAQLANVADEIAYNYHDIDDGLRSNLITLEQLQEVTIVAEQLAIIKSKYPELKSRRLHKELIRNLINITIYDLIDNTLINLKNNNIHTLNDVHNAKMMVAHSTNIANTQRELKKFLHRNLYKHHLVMQLRYKATHVLKKLFMVYMSDPYLLPEDYHLHVKRDGLHVAVTDYISGMTDRYAFRQYNRLFGTENI